MIEQLTLAALSHESGLGELVSYQQEGSDIRLDFEHGSARFSLADLALISAEISE
jgi:hypothetical protein